MMQFFYIAHSKTALVSLLKVLPENIGRIIIAFKRRNMIFIALFLQKVRTLGL
jgi:hypothetical protein